MSRRCVAMMGLPTGLAGAEPMSAATLLLGDTEMDAMSACRHKATLERRKRRRDANRQLKGWKDTYFGSGPTFLTAQGTEKPKEKRNPDETDEDSAMWRHLLKQCRSPKETSRIRRIWKRWQAAAYDTHTKEETHQYNGSFRSNFQAGSSWESGGGSASSRDSDYSSYENSSGQYTWSGDYEAFWSYGSTAGSKFWEEKQREQAGNAHPKFGQHRQPRSSVGQLSTEVRSSLLILGLESSMLPNAADLKSAFRKRALEHHPDRHAADPIAAASAEERFKEVQAAFELLQTIVVL